MHYALPANANPSHVALRVSAHAFHPLTDTVAGGLSAVIVTDVAQAVVLIIGASCMAIVGLQRVGGWEGLQAEPAPRREDRSAGRPIRAGGTSPPSVPAASSPRHTSGAGA